MIRRSRPPEMIELGPDPRVMKEKYMLIIEGRRVVIWRYTIRGFTEFWLQGTGQKNKLFHIDKNRIISDIAIIAKALKPLPLAILCFFFFCAQTKAATTAEKALFAWGYLGDKTTVGYHVYIGNSSGHYSWMVDVGLANFLQVSCIDPTFVVVRPYDKNGNEGVISNETIFTPIPNRSPLPAPASTPLGPLAVTELSPTPFPTPKPTPTITPHATPTPTPKPASK